MKIIKQPEELSTKQLTDMLISRSGVIAASIEPHETVTMSSSEGNVIHITGPAIIIVNKD